MVEEKEMSDMWKNITSAPKPEGHEERWILGVDSGGQQRVMTWYSGYPHLEGIWKYGESEESNYIAETLYFLPIKWRELPIFDKSVDL